MRIIRKISILAALLIVLLIAGCTSESGNSTDKNAITEDEYRSIATGGTGPGQVSIQLTPRGVKDGQLIVDISANTHSVDLSQFDLRQITILEYGANAANPVSAPALGGHHSSGTLIFNVEEEPEKYTIRIKGIPDLEERVFAW